MKAALLFAALAVFLSAAAASAEGPKVRTQRLDGTVRSVPVQFPLAVGPGASKTVKLTWGAAPASRVAAEVPADKTLVEATGEKGPQIRALLPARWMCDSWIVDKLCAQQARFYAKFKPLMASGCSQTHTRPPRRLNWSFVNSSLIPWLMANSTMKP